MIVLLCNYFHLTRPGVLRLLDLWHGQPVRVCRLLLLEPPLERVQDVPEPEGAHGRAGDRVGRGGEDAVDEPRVLAAGAVRALDDVRGSLCMEGGGRKLMEDPFLIRVA